MTFLQSPLVLGRDIADDALASPEVELATQSGSRPVSEPEPVEDAAERSAPPVPTRLLGFAALSGAAAAAVVGLVLSVFPLHTTSDPRVPEAIHAISDVGGQVQSLADKVRGLETEAVANEQTLQALSSRTSAAAGDVTAIRAALGAMTAAQQRASVEGAGVNVPALFGVAVVQLRDRLETGLPFDWELVNLRGIAGSDPALLAELDRLAVSARTGIVTEARLNQAMQALMAREGPSSSLVQAGIGVVSRVLGPKLVEGPTADALVLERAQARLVMGDLPNFLRQMQALTAPVAAVAKPLVTAAQQRFEALQALQILQRAARTGLENQLRSVAAIAAPVRP